MELRKYEDENGNLFFEIITYDYSALRKLEEEHKALGRKTWVNLFNCCDGKWILTVMVRNVKEGTNDKKD